MKERSLSEKKLRDDEDEELEYEIVDLRDETQTNRHDKYLTRLSNELQLGPSTIYRTNSNIKGSFFARLFDLSQDCSFHPNNKYYFTPPSALLSKSVLGILIYLLNKNLHLYINI